MKKRNKRTDRLKKTSKRQLVIKENIIEIYDKQGILRVRIGSW